MEELKQLKDLVEKWQQEIINTLQKGNEIIIRKNKDNVVLYQNIIKKEVTNFVLSQLNYNFIENK